MHILYTHTFFVLSVFTFLFPSKTTKNFQDNSSPSACHTEGGPKKRNDHIYLSFFTYQFFVNFEYSTYFRFLRSMQKNNLRNNWNKRPVCYFGSPCILFLHSLTHHLFFQLFKNNIIKINAYSRIFLMFFRFCTVFKTFRLTTCHMNTLYTKKFHHAKLKMAKDKRTSALGT